MPCQEPKTNSSRLYLRLRKMDDLGLVLTLTHIQNTFYSQLTVKILTSWQMMCYMSISVWNIKYNSVCSSLSASVCSTALCKYSQELHHVVTGNGLNTIPFFPQTQVQNVSCTHLMLLRVNSSDPAGTLCVFLHRLEGTSPASIALCSKRTTVFVSMGKWACERSAGERESHLLICNNQFSCLCSHHTHTLPLPSSFSSWSLHLAI